MKAFIIIIGVLLMYWFFFRRQKPARGVLPIKQEVAPKKELLAQAHKLLFVDENGKQYWKENKEVLIPRKTYIKGIITGKYRGDLLDQEQELHNSAMYSFEIYQAEVSCQEFREKIPFHNKGVLFPKERLPEIIPVSLMQEDQWYGLNILEPKLSDFQSVKKLHQIEAAQVFGTFTGEITGYILDHTARDEEERIYVPEIIEEASVPEEKLMSSGTETGKTEQSGDYLRKEFYTTNYKDTLWGNWEYNRLGRDAYSNGGFFSFAIGGIGFLFGLVFLITILPGLVYIVPLFVIVLLFTLFEDLFKWIFRVVACLFVLVFLFSVIITWGGGKRNYNPQPLIVDNARESNPEIRPVTDTAHTDGADSLPKTTKDTIITRYRSWQDYNGNHFEGSYQVKASDFNKAHGYKSTLEIHQPNHKSYDEMVYRLKEYDKNKLSGLYKLLDSISAGNNLNEIQFAEMAVSFVQDIPYTLILANDCKVSLYNDDFTRKYLSRPDARCSGNQKFGINTPVEFLATLNGDCDTRTLLLYTVFSHYGYDVALLCSEQYGHSLLGINLPIDGTAYTYNNQRYVLWETTSPHLRPGLVSAEISNLNNWRISIKSK